MLTTTVREALYNPDALDEAEDEDRLMEHILTRAFARTGLTGTLDIPLQLVTGIKYQTDFASAYAGPAIREPLQVLEAMVALGLKNNPNTDTAERNALKAALEYGAQGALNMSLALTRTGPVSNALSGGALYGLDILSPAERLADAAYPEE